jgi:hypothetical protein
MHRLAAIAHISVPVAEAVLGCKDAVATANH